MKGRIDQKGDKLTKGQVNSGKKLADFVYIFEIIYKLPLSETLYTKE